MFVAIRRLKRDLDTGHRGLHERNKKPNVVRLVLSFDTDSVVVIEVLK